MLIVHIGDYCRYRDLLIIILTGLSTKITSTLYTICRFPAKKPISKQILPHIMIANYKGLDRRGSTSNQILYFLH